jgi:small subunit ribosomal protein S21
MKYGISTPENDFAEALERRLSSLTEPGGESLSLRLRFNRNYRKAGEDRVAEVKLGDNETLESALRRFKRKVQQEDIIREVKRHAFYIPPGEKRRLKSALARKRNRKKYRRYIIPE